MEELETAFERTGVDVPGLLKTLAESLYSTPEVVVRELVQNAHDSCTRRQVEGDDEAGAIRVGVDPSAGELWVEDEGAGLTREEIGTYLATIGRGYTRVLRDQLGEEQGDEGLIGYFGLGFLSAYVVSAKTEVWTCSRSTPDEPWLFTTRSGDTYTVRPGAARPVGTRVTLTLADAHRTLGSRDVIADILRRYTCLLPIPVELESPGGRREVVNELEVPWTLPEETPRPKRQQVAGELAARFEPSYEVLATLPVRHRADGVELDGLLWIQDGWSYGSADNRHVSVFVRGMLIGGRERELLPAWASFVGVVIECPQLNPTTSRESLRDDERYHRVAQALREQLIAGLARLRSDDPAAWSRLLRRHNEALLGAAVAEPQLFDALRDGLTLPTSEGDLRAEVLLDRGQGTIFVSHEERTGFAELLLRATRRPVVHGHRYGALAFAKRFADSKGARVVVIGGAGDDAALFSRARVEPAEREALERMFAPLGHEIVPARFEPDWLPLVIVPNREAELKQRIEDDEADARISAGVLRLARSFTAQVEASSLTRLYVNVRAPLIRKLVAEPDGTQAVLDLLIPAAELWSFGYSEKADFEGSLRRLNATLEGLL